MGEQLERKCIWDKRLNYAKWENVSNNDICKKQVMVFVMKPIFSLKRKKMEDRIIRQKGLKSKMIL